MIGSGKLACAGVMGLAALGAFAASAIAQSSAAPHIVARPHIVMVNGTTTLIGAGFPPDKSILLRECSTKLWIVPQEPCDTTNEQTITTSSAGTFTTLFTVQPCPGILPVGPVPEEICFIGEPNPTGIDEVRLVGAAKIIVTFP
jgi:hypothetical protein